MEKMLRTLVTVLVEAGWHLSASVAGSSIFLEGPDLNKARAVGNWENEWIRRRYWRSSLWRPSFLPAPQAFRQVEYPVAYNPLVMSSCFTSCRHYEMGTHLLFLNMHPGLSPVPSIFSSMIASPSLHTAQNKETGQRTEHRCHISHVVYLIRLLS